MSDRDLTVTLIRELRALATQIDVPPPADITADVRRAIAALPSRRPATPWLTALRPALVTVVGVIAAIALVLAASPAARETVADWLGVGGIDIQVRPTESGSEAAVEQPTETVGDPLQTSAEISLPEARTVVAFAVRVPERLGEPDRVYVDESWPDGVITMVWAPSADLPEIGSSDVGALFSTFRSDVQGDFLTKVLGSFEDVEQARVDGARGIWFGGPPHLVARDANGVHREVNARLSGHSLIWERNGITYRLEADLPRDEMVAIGSSLR